jgi:anti-sigma factor RsiW
MTCQEFETRLAAYVDGELDVGDTVAGDAHAAACWRCASLARREREFRALLRRQPREVAPAELHARVRAEHRAERRRRILVPRLVAPALAAAAAVAVTVLLPVWRQEPLLVPGLVDKHIAYAQVERPAELPSSEPAEITEWFMRRGLRVTVPDYTPAGIRLVGARLAESHERRAAYLLYQKGMTLLSVFMVPVSGGDVDLPGTRASYRGQPYMTWEWKGHRTVSWTDGRTVFGLVSMLDYEALLECADRLRQERAAQTRL